MIIYKTTNLVNGKIYVGSDKNNNPKYLGSGRQLLRAIEKYGIENFQKEILEECNSISTLKNREGYWIIKLQSNNQKIGYNISDGYWGGDTTSNHPDRLDIIMKRTKKNKGKHRTDEQKKNISESLIEYYKLNPDRQVGINNGNYGKKHPGLNKGMSLSSDACKKISDFHKGKKKSESFCLQIRKKIYQYALDGTFIAEWNSLDDVYTNLGFKKTVISACCNGRQNTSHGYMWRHIKI